MRIIVVDDDRIIRIGLCKIISNLFDQHEVCGEFQNGREAFEYLKNNEVDMVITDIKMPVMTGIELIKVSNENLERPPVFIILSGYDEFSYVRDTMKLGALNYLLKPIKKNALKEIIEEVDAKITIYNKENTIMDKSLKLLRKDFFTHMLFESEKEEKIREEYIECLRFKGDILYKFIIIKPFYNAEILDTYLENIKNEYKDIESTIISKNDCGFIILFIENDKDREKKEMFLEEELKCFVQANSRVFVFNATNMVKDIKSEKEFIDEIIGQMYSEQSPGVFHLDKNVTCESYLRNKEEDYSSVAVRLSREYIKENYFRPITLKELSEKVFLSQNYLSELFKRETGEGFYEFLSKYRIEQAKRILLTTNLRVYEIGKKVGYNDAITFGRAFKKITGMTPNKFRSANSSSKQTSNL